MHVMTIAPTHGFSSSTPSLVKANFAACCTKSSYVRFGDDNLDDEAIAMTHCYESLDKISATARYYAASLSKSLHRVDSANAGLR
jgi:hypothetical protein